MELSCRKTGFQNAIKVLAKSAQMAAGAIIVESSKNLTSHSMWKLHALAFMFVVHPSDNKHAKSFQGKMSSRISPGWLSIAVLSCYDMKSSSSTAVARGSADGQEGQ